jgi:nucleoid DNA-binding protein
MNKSELILAIAERGRLSKAYATDAIDSMIDIILETVQNNENVKISGFGTFGLKVRKARVGRNPKNGETIEVPASNSIRFAPSKEVLK